MEILNWFTGGFRLTAGDTFLSVVIAGGGNFVLRLGAAWVWIKVVQEALGA
jgi:hypothetical protein